MFVPDGHTLTFGEMEPDAKHAISHRARAFQPFARACLGDGAAAEDDAGFGVYVHWPFCASKCPYCDFNSHVRAGGIDEARFLRAYLTRAAALGRAGAGPRGHQRVLRRRHALAHVARAPWARFSMRSPARGASAADAEITLEANPSSVEAARFRGYRAAGVNRVSLGVQSLDDADLRALGRLHTAEEALAAIDVARTTFERCSFDLIYARPGQTLQAWRAELAQALALAGRHLSLYQLTIEPETPFAALHARGKLVVPDGDMAHALYELTQEMTRAAGLPAYEISNHAAPGEECRHNLTYWRYGEYAGIGPGAHGRVVTGGGAPRHRDGAAARALGRARRGGGARLGGEARAEPRPSRPTRRC